MGVDLIRLNLPQMTWENFQTFVYTQHFSQCISLLQVYKRWYTGIFL